MKDGVSMAVTKKTSGSKRTAGGAGNRKGSAASKKVTTNQKASRGRSTGKKTTSSGRKKTTAGQRKNNIEAMQEYQDHQAFEVGITIFVIGILAVIFYLSYFGLAGKVGTVIGGLLFGVFGWFAWFLPAFMMIGYIFFIVNQGDRRVPRRMISFSGIVLSLMGLSDLIFEKQIITEYYISNHVFHKDYFDCMYLTCDNVLSRGKFNGGLCGRGVSSIFSAVIGKVGAVIVIFALLLLFLYIFYGVELMGILRRRNARQQEMAEIHEQIQGEEDYKEPSYRVFTPSSKAQSFQKTGRGLKPAPELEKVPKVQSFDLQELNHRLDQLERKQENSKGSISARKKQEKPMEDNSTQKTQGQSDGLREEKNSQYQRRGYQGIDSTVVEVKEGNVGKRQEVSAVDSKGENGAQEMTAEISSETVDSEIPIYRNELNKKFGGKKREKKQNIPAPVQVVREAESVYSGNTDKIQPVPEAVSHEEPAGVSEALPPQENEKTEENVIGPAKPMNSFVHKEEVTDVTPSSQKKAQKEKREQPGEMAVKDVEKKTEQIQEKEAEKTVSQKAPVEEKPYVFPSIDLLAQPEMGSGSMSDYELRATATKLQETLKSFNVNVQIGAVTCGPTVTRYEVLPEQGVRVNKITNLADDLKLSLAAPSIRIEAPIPGKAAVGIEVPNVEASTVSFRELLEGDTFAKAKSPLTFAVGKDIAGKLIMADIGKMPHVLIAGATGSGKSVCINTLIMSILYKADPKDVKLIMIDPKVVELSVYNGIPHLFCPVVTDPKEAAAALNWAVREMMDRYNKFKELGVRNISGYNEKIKRVEDAARAGYEKMPYLVVIVDEFADLMMVASKEVEDAVCRLAQLARAAGIHLVLATQRPSVNVITGVIKANIPSRVAFSVSSAIDSRTILDKGGAEKLLGKGDMLFFPSGYTEPVRVQGAFVSDKEVSDVVDFLCNSNETPEYNHAVTEMVEVPQEEAPVEKKTAPDRDEYFEDAGRFVIESERAAAGQLQRHFSIGFNRAGRIIDQLNKAGVVGPAEGTKPRKVLMTMEQFEAMLSGAEGGVSQEEMESMNQEMESLELEQPSELESASTQEF